MSVRKPAGFWDVEGVPVVETVRGCFVAVDSEAPRRFPGDSVYRNGGEVSEERFAELFPESVPRIAAALSSPLLDANAAPVDQNTTPARFPNPSTERSEHPPPPPSHPAWTPETTALFQRNAAATAQAMVDNLNRKAKEGDPKG